MEGIVKWWNDHRGFGFIESEGEDFFVHFSQIITNERRKSLFEDDEVTFEIGQDSQGRLTAKNVKILRLT